MHYYFTYPKSSADLEEKKVENSYKEILQHKENNDGSKGIQTTVEVRPVGIISDRST